MADRLHNYDYPVDENSNTAAAKVIRFVGQGKRVLEIGCGPGSITKYLKKRNNTIVGLEIDPEALKLVSPYCEQALRFDLNGTDWPELEEKVGVFDTIIAADVLEHLYDPWQVLQHLHTLLKPEGEVVVSLPHVGHAAICGCLMNSTFEYRDWGLLDRTHIRFFGLADVDNLFETAGFKLIDVSFVVKRPEETEFAHVWASMNQRQKDILREPAHSYIYQVVVKAVPQNAFGVPISVRASLHSQREALHNSKYIMGRIKAFLSAMLP